MGWISTIIVGGIAGWLASMVMKRDGSMGVFLNVIVGIMGGVIGSWIGTYTGFLSSDGSWAMYLVTAFVGAVVLLAIVNLIQRGRLT